MHEPAVIHVMGGCSTSAFCCRHVPYVKKNSPRDLLCRVWLVKPSEGLSTQVVFRHLEYDQLSSKDPAQLLKQFVEIGVSDAEYVNDLELPAFKAMPSLRQMKRELEVREQEYHSNALSPIATSPLGFTIASPQIRSDQLIPCCQHGSKGSLYRTKLAAV